MAVSREDFVVGQQWWFSPGEKRNSPRWLTVASFGRKIVKFKETQAYVDLSENNGDSVRIRTKDFGGLGLLFRSQEEHAAYAGVIQRKQRFYRAVSGFHFCMNLTEQQVVEAAKILGIDLEKNE
jgi:hypothetical protein